ncbi:MAG: hypothetical protein ACYCPQ_05020 [Elusimicrobiota bacterium]
MIGFLIGAAAGIHYEKKVFHRFWQHGPSVERSLSRLTRRLHLTSGQRRQLDDILEANHGKVMALHRQVASQFDDIRHSFRQDFSGILSPEQKKAFAAMTAKWDARRRTLMASALSSASGTRQGR